MFVVFGVFEVPGGVRIALADAFRNSVAQRRPENSVAADSLSVGKRSGCRLGFPLEFPLEFPSESLSEFP